MDIALRFFLTGRSSPGPQPDTTYPFGLSGRDRNAARVWWDVKWRYKT